MASTSCFFCQNLLSDFIEGFLPAQRHEEVKEHLATCHDCAHLQEDLKDTMGMLKKFPLGEMDQQTQERIRQATHRGRAVWRSRSRVSRWVMGSTVPILASIAFFLLFPQFFPWRDIFSSGDDESQFVRFFPLMHGASDIIDEQTSWLHGRDLEGGSLWEEGGISPDEFEKVFQPGRREIAP